MHGQVKSIVAVIVLVAGVTLPAGHSEPQPEDQFELVSTIAFGSTRQNPECDPFLATEVFLMSPDGTNLQRLTDNDGCTHADAAAALSPGGKKIVYDSNRLTTNILFDSMGRPRLNISDLFAMSADGTEQTFLTRGSSATWSPDGKNVAFHASASYHTQGITLPPIRTDPGAPTIDSDIFVANVYDVIAGAAVPMNITNSLHMIEEDANWSPDGTKIVFTSDPVDDGLPGANYPAKEIFVINADGTGLTRLTFNTYEERAPAWSPDGSRIVFMCRIGDLLNPKKPAFEICVMDANGANLVQLTDNEVFDGTPNYSPDGQKILFQRPSGVGRVSPHPTLSLPFPQLFVVDADTTCNDALTPKCTCSAMLLGGFCETRLSTGNLESGPNFLGGQWGQLRVHK